MKTPDLPMEDQLRLFAICNQLAENALDIVENSEGLDLGRGHRKSLGEDRDYYPQIDRDIRITAAKMSEHYEVFYSLENSIRDLIVDTLASAEPGDWWQSGRVPANIKQEAEARMKRELDAGVTPRSAEPIDFTTFGELSEIIKSNWDVFSFLTSQKAVEKVMSSLNTLRGPIAHCSPLAEDEIVRLRLSVKDWFRLME